MTTENEPPVHSLAYGQREAEELFHFQGIQEMFRAGAPVECKCGCHSPTIKMVMIHFRPCCQACPKCRKGFKAGLTEHLVACGVVQDANPAIESQPLPKCEAQMEDWWAEPVKAIYLDLLRDLGGQEDLAMYGPGHIAWADGNFDDRCVDFCLEACDDPTGHWVKHGEAALNANREALKKLRAVSEEIRDCDPYDDYGDE